MSVAHRPIRGHAAPRSPHAVRADGEGSVQVAARPGR